VNAYGRERAVTVREAEEGIHAEMTLKGYEQERVLQTLMQGVMVMAMGRKKSVARSRGGECYR
jgi:hypothetical protein